MASRWPILADPIQGRSCVVDVIHDEDVFPGIGIFGHPEIAFSFVAVSQAHFQGVHGHVKILADEIGRSQSSTRETYHVVGLPAVSLQLPQDLLRVMLHVVPAEIDFFHVCLIFDLGARDLCPLVT